MSDTATAPRTATLPTKTEVRKVVGTGKFAVSDFAEGAEVSLPTARKRIAALVEAGSVEALGEFRKNTDAEGNALRGRPAPLFRVVKGK